MLRTVTISAHTHLTEDIVRVGSRGRKNCDGALKLRAILNSFFYFVERLHVGSLWQMTSPSIHARKVRRAMVTLVTLT